MKAKILISLTLLSLINHVKAQDKNEAGKMAEHKAKMIQMIDKEITILQNHKSCINSANDHESMKKCHDQTKAEREKLQAEHKQMQVQEMDEKIKHLEEQKQKMMHK